MKIVDSWVVRRLGPDAFKVEIEDLDLRASEEEELTKKLLEAMGKEIANVHSPSSDPSNDALTQVKALSSNPTSSEWLFDSAMTMAEQTNEDFNDWKKEGYECPPDEKESLEVFHESTVRIAATSTLSSGAAEANFDS